MILSVAVICSIFTTKFVTRTLHMSDTEMFHPDPARKLSANLYDIYHCCVYSEKLVMMDRGIV